MDPQSRLKSQEFKEGETLGDKWILLIDTHSAGDALAFVNDHRKIDFNLRYVPTLSDMISDAVNCMSPSSRGVTVLAHAGCFVVAYQQDRSATQKQMVILDAEKVPSIASLKMETPLLSERVDAAIDECLALRRQRSSTGEDDEYMLSAELSPR